MAMDKIYTVAEVLTELAKKKDATNLDAFRVRINRREHPSLPPGLLATFDNVTFGQISTPETWLLDLFGGGAFELTCCHMSDPNTAVSGVLKYTYDTDGNPPKKPGFDEIHKTVSAETWVGPVLFIYPRVGTHVFQKKLDTVKSVVDAPALSTTSVGGPAIPVIVDTMATSKNPVERHEASRLGQVSQDLMRQEREIDRERMRLEMERMRLEMKPASAPTFDIQAIIAAAAPFVTAMMDNNRKAEERMFAMQQAQQQQTLEMMKMMTAKPAIDPDLKATLEVIKDTMKKDDGVMLANYSNMIGTMANTTMQIIQSNAEMMNAMQPQQESPAYKLARQAMVSLGTVLGNTSPANKLLPEEDEQQEQGPEQQAVPEEQPKKYSQLELLERGLRRKDPKEKVALRLQKALKSKKFMEYVRTQFGGNLLNLVSAHLGTWAAEDAENLEYLQDTLKFAYEEAVRVGAIRVQQVPENGSHKNSVQEPATQSVAPKRVKAPTPETVPEA